MNNRPECPGHEDVVRAICTAHYDEGKERFSSQLFAGTKISVSRLAVLPIEKLFPIFHSDLDMEDPPNTVKWAGEIKVSKLRNIGENHKEAPVKLTVEIDPTEKNPAHAEIPQKITRGLAFKIIKGLKLHNDPSVAFSDRSSPLS